VGNGNIYTQPLQDDSSIGGAASWFNYKPSGTGLIDIVSCHGGADTNVNLWQGTCNSLQFIFIIFPVNLTSCQEK